MGVVRKTKNSLNFCSQPDGHTGLVPFGIYISSNCWITRASNAQLHGLGKYFSNAISVFQLHLILLIISHMNSLTAFSWTSPRQQFRGGTWVCLSKHSLWLLHLPPSTAPVPLSDTAQPLSSLLPSPHKSCSPEKEGKSEEPFVILNYKVQRKSLMEIIITYLSLPNVLSCRCSWASQLNTSFWLAVHLRSNQCIHPAFLCTFLAYERQATSSLCSISLSINRLHFALTKTILWQLGKMIITQCFFTPYPAPPNSAACINLKEENITRVGRKKSSCHKKLNLWKFNFLQRLRKHKLVCVLTYTIKLGMFLRCLVVHYMVSPTRSCYTVAGLIAAFREAF